MTGAVLVASDLDRTLIYSAAAFGMQHARPAMLAVERFNDADSSFVTEAAGRYLVDLAGAAHFVPITTRIPTQLARVRLPGPPPRFAVASNGGVLLVDGEPDPFWSRLVSKRLAESAPLPVLWRQIESSADPDWLVRLRNADDLFCYAIVERATLPEGWLRGISDWAVQRGWRTSLQGRKLYWVPAGLTKAAAVSELAERLGCTTVLAAGDSLLDIDLLQRADHGVMPRHGELYESGWHAPHVQLTADSGILAGEEIAAWLLTRSRAVRSAPAQRPLR